MHFFQALWFSICNEALNQLIKSAFNQPYCNRNLLYARRGVNIISAFAIFKFKV